MRTIWKLVMQWSSVSNWAKTLQKFIKCFRLFIDQIVWTKHLFFAVPGDSRTVWRRWKTIRDVEGRGDVRTSELVEKNKEFSGWRTACVYENNTYTIWSFGVTTVQRFIREDLEVGKICAKFVLKVINGEKKERRVGDSREIVGGHRSCPSSSDCGWPSKLSFVLRYI